EGKENWKSELAVDAYHVGNFTRFLNHSCNPNSRLYPCYTNEGNINKPLLAIFAIRDIEPKEEICFSYSGDYPDDEQDKPPSASQESKPSTKAHTQQKDENEDDGSEEDTGDEHIIWEVCSKTACFQDTFKVTLPTGFPVALNDPQLHMIVYLQVAIIAQVLIFGTHSHGFFFMECPSVALTVTSPS
ncbi:hypothetical protein CVT24_002431, partial [Panaeolus cyanescens]